MTETSTHLANTPLSNVIKGAPEAIFRSHLSPAYQPPFVMSYNQRVVHSDSISIQSYSPSAYIPTINRSASATASPLSPPRIPYISNNQLTKHFPNQLLDLPNSINKKSDPINYKLDLKKKEVYILPDLSSYNMTKQQKKAATSVAKKGKLPPASMFNFDKHRISHPLPITTRLPPISRFIDHPFDRLLDKNSTQKNPDGTPSPYICATCQLTFGRKNSLRRHEQLHSGVKPFHCTACNRSFSRKDIYMRHLNSKRCQKLSSLRHPDSRMIPAGGAQAPTQASHDMNHSSSNTSEDDEAIGSNDAQDDNGEEQEIQMTQTENTQQLVQTEPIEQPQQFVQAQPIDQPQQLVQTEQIEQPQQLVQKEPIEQSQQVAQINAFEQAEQIAHAEQLIQMVQSYQPEQIAQTQPTKHPEELKKE